MDVAFKAVGVGSVGTIWVLVGLFLSADGEPLFLGQVKQAQRSVLERHSKKELAYQGPQGRRVVEGQRMMQAASDIFLGWTSDEPLGIEFYVRILKKPPSPARSASSLEQQALPEYARLCGRTLARAHARSGRPWPSWPATWEGTRVRRRARFIRHGLRRADGQGLRRVGEG